MRRFLSAALPAALIAVLCAPAAPGAAGITSPARSARSSTSGSLLPADHAWQVTLVTGDVVGVRTVRGRPPMVTITPGPGRRGMVYSRYVDSTGQVVVIPQDVVPLLGRVLDPALFDVTALVRAGYSDARRASLPLVVQARAGTSARAAAAAVSPALRPGRTLPGRNAVAVAEPKASAARIGAQLARIAWAESRSGRMPARVAGNLRHIWLGPAARAGGTRVACARTGQAKTYLLTIRATPLRGTAPGKMSGFADIANLATPSQCGGSVTIGPSGVARLRVPAGHYWVYGEVDDLTSATAPRSAMAGQPEVIVHNATTVTLDGARAVPVTSSVSGHPTQVAEDYIHVERRFAGIVAGFDVLNFRRASRPVLFAQPTGTAKTGTFGAYIFYNLASPLTARSRYAYNLWHPVGNRIPAWLDYRVTPAQQSRLARVNVRLYALDGSHAQVWDIRYGLDPAGFLAAEADSRQPGGTTRTDYVSTGGGMRWDQEAVPPFRVGGQDRQGDWVIEVPRFAQLAPGSVQIASWIRQPFAPGPYSATVPTLSACAPHASARNGNIIHVELTDLQDLPDGFDCLFFTGDLSGTTRTMRLYSGGKLIGTTLSSVSDFTVPARSLSFRLRYTDNTSSVLPVSTRTDTVWTFRARPGTRIPLLLVRYQLPLNLDNHPDGSTAVLTVGRIAGVHTARVTSVRFWTSTDQGKTWQQATVRKLAAGRYAVPLPHAAAGQSVSLRVAADAGGGSITQTILTAYHR